MVFGDKRRVNIRETLRWSDEMETALCVSASMGAKDAAKFIYAETGKALSISAIKNKASRMGISLKRLYVCPSCGGAYSVVHSDGFCTTCHYRRLRDAYTIKEQTYNESDVLKAKKEYDLARKHKSLDFV